MRIVEIRERTIPVGSNIRNAYMDFSQMTGSTVAVVTDVVRDGRPVIGFGFNSVGRYNVSCQLRDRFIPRVLRADPESLLDESGTNLDPERTWKVMFAGEKPGGHGERASAIGAVDMALWDAVAKIADQPLYRLLADRYRSGQADDSVLVYAAGGYYQPEKGPQALRDEIQGYLDLGYTAVKIKIGGAPLDEDLRRIEAVLALVGGKGECLAVDANGRFDLATALRYGDAMAPYNLRWYEEPGDPLDFEIQARLGEAYPGPLATGENLFSVQDARNLVRYGGMRADRDVLQFDPPLAYGLVEYLRILGMLAEHGWSARNCIPHGGHQFSLNIAAGLGLGGNESYPGVFQPLGGFADGIPVEDGYVRLPDVPGVGFEVKSNLYPALRSLVEDLLPALVH